MSPVTYIDRMIETYVRIFGSKPKKNVTSPLEKGDHPELDTTEELDIVGIKKYQSLIGSAQWVVSLGRFDVSVEVMTMSRFITSPRKVHMERVKRIYSYLSKMKHETLRFRIESPDLSGISIPEYQWEKSVYVNVKEEFPHDAPKPLGKEITMTTYVDANLCHDIVTGRSVTGILHFANKSLIDFYSKRQATVETDTYGSEFVASRTETEHIIDIRTTMRYLGVPIKGPTYMFGDNKSVVDSSMDLSTRLHKRHMILSYHRVRESIAANIVKFIYIPGKYNPDDIQSKVWGYQQIWNILKSILFWEGDTSVI